MTTSLDLQRITVTLKRLVELLESEDEDDYGILKPSNYAFKTVMNLVLEVHSLMGNSFPKASASTDHQGGIRLDWTSLESDREVCLVCPFSPERSVYIYHQTSDNHAVEDDISPLILVKWLEWLAIFMDDHPLSSLPKLDLSYNLLAIFLNLRNLPKS